jgi:hypothetical protein
VDDWNIRVHVSDVKGGQSGVFIQRYVFQVINKVFGVFNIESVGEGSELVEKFC